MAGEESADKPHTLLVSPHIFTSSVSSPEKPKTIFLCTVISLQLCPPLKMAYKTPVLATFRVTHV